jgi:hypothetical protein
MRAKSKLVSFALCAVLMFGFALTASAQVSHLVSSTPTDVIQTGLAEVMGEVRLTKNNAPTGTPQTTIAGTINVLYQGVPIVNLFSGSIPITVNGGGAGIGRITAANGITIDATGGYNVAGLSALVSNTPVGGLLTLSIPGGLVINEGDTIIIDGVRATVTGLAVATDVNASIQSNPPNAHSFLNVSTVRVARTNPGLIVNISGVTSPICVLPPSPFPVINVLEGFPGAFVQYVTVAGVAPANPRTKYGANLNTQIHITIGTLPTPDVTLTWPDTVTASRGVGTLVLVSSTDSDALYQFTTTDQAASDLGIEWFAISPTVELAATSGFGQGTIQAQLYPPAILQSAIPRYDDPLQPATPGNFLNVSKCVTNLLFPWAANTDTFDTGVAIANTSMDPFTPATLGQSGAITFYGYAQFPSGGTAPAPITFTTPVIEAGNTFAGTASGTLTGFAGFRGYVIAVCQFQFAHGFAFITGTYGSSAPVVAEGYMALVIPDPSVVGGARKAAPSDPSKAAGESLSE